MPEFGLTASNLSIDCATHTLIAPSHFALTAPARVGLVGRNGGGKTTLLEVLHRLNNQTDLPEYVRLRGSVAFRPGTRLGYLRQDPAIDFDGTVQAFLQSSAGERGRTAARFSELTKALAAGDGDGQLLEEYAAVLEAMDKVGGWDFEREQTQVLDALDLPAEALALPLAAISGGQAARAQLAGLLLSPANVLLLDEPSNNLDAASIRFLVEWLEHSSAAVLLVSHDTWLLDRLTKETLEIDEPSGELRHFAGGWSAAAAAKDAEREEQLTRAAEQRDKVDRLQRSANRLAGLADRSQNLSANDYYRARGKKIGRKARIQRERIEREITAIGEPALPAMPRFAVLQPEPRTGALVRLERVGFSYTERAPLVLDNVTLQVRAGERLALMDANGTGKSTLLRLLAGELRASRGHVWRSPGVSVGFLRQAPAMESGESLLAFGQRLLGLPDDDVRQLIGRVIFQDAQLSRAADLSLGQLRRVDLSLLFASAPDLLLLDEPTNHVDLQTVHTLERALEEYTGALVVATHDRGFVERVGIQRILTMAP